MADWLWWLVGTAGYVVVGFLVSVEAFVHLAPDGDWDEDDVPVGVVAGIFWPLTGVVWLGNRWYRFRLRMRGSSDG